MAQVDVDFILDTNVINDAQLLQDLDAIADDEQTSRRREHRIERVRAALLLGCYFHEIGAQTAVLYEAIEILQERAPPHGTELITNHQSFWREFVWSTLLPGWRIGCVDGTQGVCGNRADDLLLDLAIQENVPLITNEGWGETKLQATKKKGALRKKAKDQDHPVFTSFELLLDRGADLSQLANEFLSRWDDLAPTYIETHQAKFRYRTGELENLIGERRDLYEWRLFGRLG